jgi:ribosomal protein L24E
MADQDQQLCDNCHERPGTNHICYGGSSGESRSLCQICLMQDSEFGGLMQRAHEALRTGRCEYCGAPAETGSGRFSLDDGEHFDLLCKMCEEDLTEFDRQPDNAIPDWQSGDETAKKQMLLQWTKLQRRREEFIRKRVLERKLKGGGT